MSISFGYPLALGLLLLLPLFYWISRGKGSRSIVRRNNRRFSLALRLAIVTILILTIADIQIVTVSNKIATVFLVDASDSVGSNGKNQELDFVRQAMAKMDNNDEAGVVVFGQNALVEKLVSTDKTVDDLQSTPDSGYTNVAEAVRLGTALLPSDAQRRLVLLSDGNQNIDDVESAAKIAAANGVQIDVVPVKVSSGNDVNIAAVNAPSNLRQGEQFNLTVNVNSTYDGSGRLVIMQDGKVISDNPVNFKKGDNSYTQKLQADQKGFANYTAKIIANGDTVDQNNEASAYSVVSGKPKILIVDGHPDQNESGNLEAALKAASVDTQVVNPENFPALSSLTQFDSVVLVDVPANTMPQGSLDVLQSYVRDLGKGLVVVGGEESYALGGYFRTPLEDMLPVQLQLPSKLETPSVAMVIVIDRSGSMADNYKGSVKIEMAKDAAYQAAAQLSSSDEVGVISFDTEATWNVQLAPMGNPANLVSPIGQIAPGGGTSIITGLQPAVKALEGVQAKDKQVILLTDGQDSDSNVDYSKVFQEANANNINVSTVGLGDDVNTTFLSNMAAKNNGRYYFVDDPSTLPRIFAKEVHLIARSYIVEENFTPQIAAPSPILKDITALPQLKGYVGTQPKNTATTALVSDKGDPILAQWQYGLGRVVAWTSDAEGKWAVNWMGWSGFSQFWSQVVRWTIPQNDAASLQVRTENVGNKIYIQADAINANSQFMDGLDAQASVVAANLDGTKEQVTLQQTAPGHYEGYFTPSQPGSYLVNVQASGSDSTSKNNSQVNLSQVVGAVQSYSPEYLELGTNTVLLSQIASITNGQILSKPEQAFSNSLNRNTQNSDLWPWLLLLAILLFPLDVGIRRISFSLKRLREGFMGRKVLQSATAASPSSASQLFDAKNRAGQNRKQVSENMAADSATAISNVSENLANATPTVQPNFNVPPMASSVSPVQQIPVQPQPMPVSSVQPAPPSADGGQSPNNVGKQPAISAMVARSPETANPPTPTNAKPTKQAKAKAAEENPPVEEDDLTSRLLKAKQRAREERRR